jgi:DNA-binding GntR family transcriptional regulator
MGNVYDSIDLNRSSPVPLYFQVALQIQELRDQGNLGRDDALPSEGVLAAQLHVSRPTIHHALTILATRR